VLLSANFATVPCVHKDHKSNNSQNPGGNEMKRHSYILALLALAGVFAVAQDMPRQKDDPQQRTPTSQQPTSDQDKATTANTADVQKDIQSALQQEPTLATANINVQVAGKNVELSGTVPSKDAKDKAEQIAKSHAGGLAVKNHLKVTGS
jgi:osmotically-inducible protein OsmY